MTNGKPEYLKEIEQWLKKKKMTESHLGLLAAANQRAIQRIREGTAQVSTLQAVLKYIEANPAKR